MMTKRIAIAVAIIAAMALVLTLYLPRARQVDVSPQGTVAIGGPFTLVNTKGDLVSEVDLKGRYSLIFFGFTHCPDICPIALQTMTQALRAAGPVATKVQPVFITVDPERDPPEVMAAYLASFDPRFWGLTGTPDQVKGAETSYKVFAAKAPMKDANGQPTGDYTMNHTGFIYLMDRNGAYAAHFDKDASADDIAKRIAALQ